MIQFIGTTIRYENQQPVREFNLGNFKGEKAVFTGPSGSGKSSY